jgi:hypothetical protein
MNEEADSDADRCSPYKLWNQTEVQSALETWNLGCHEMLRSMSHDFTIIIQEFASDILFIIEKKDKSLSPAKTFNSKTGAG